MREIKFRGYCEKINELRYGFYISYGGRHEILTSVEGKGLYASPVNPETVGQFTGLKDCNGVEIYEGDIVEAETRETTSTPPDGVISMRKGEKFYTGRNKVSRWSVEFVDHITYTGFMFYGIDRRFHLKATKSTIINCGVRVVGNIHQNPELLEDAEQ